jgi:hypothetical protein
MNRLREIVARFTAALTVLRARWLGYDIFISYTHRDAKALSPIPTATPKVMQKICNTAWRRKRALFAFGTRPSS